MKPGSLHLPAAGVDVERAVELGAEFVGPEWDRHVWMRPEDYRKCLVPADPAVRQNIENQKRNCKGCG